MIRGRTIPEVNSIENCYAQGKGRMFGRWTDNDGSARDNGYNENDLIEQPAYIIESILRDEMFVERDLTITTKVGSSGGGGFYYYTITVDGLKYSVDDYYNNAEVINVTTGVKHWVDDYTGLTKTVVLKSTVDDSSLAANNNIYFTNVNGNNRINSASFDLVGNTSDGKRNGGGNNWKFAKSINQPAIASGVIKRICFESHCILFQSYNQYKLVALDSALSADTWTKCLMMSGRESFNIGLTQLQNIFTSFKLKYSYDYGSGEYEKEFYVDKNGYTSGGSVISSTEQDLCEAAETNYKIKNNFEYSSDWIYDLTTAEKLLQKLVLWFTKQRMVVTWTTSLSDGSIDYVKYELGDQVVLSNTRILPTGISGVKCFMITGKQIIIKRGDPYIVWNLIEMEGLPT